METVVTVEEQNGTINIQILQNNDQNAYERILRHLIAALFAHITNSPDPDHTFSYAIRALSAYASE